MLSYKRATIEDFEELYHIKCDQENIAWGGFKQAPNRESFHQWYQRQMLSDSRWIFLIYEDDVCCAFCYIDKLEDGSYEASSSGVLKEYMGKGIGTYALYIRVIKIKQFGGKRVQSWVSDKNIASYKRYEKLGFILTDEFEIRNLPLLGGEHKFFKWIKEL